MHGNRLWGRIGEIAVPTALAFHNGMEDRNADGLVNSFTAATSAPHWTEIW